MLTGSSGQGLALLLVPAPVLVVPEVGDLDERRAAGLEHAGDLGELGAGFGKVVHDAHHGDQVERRVVELQVVGLHLHLVDVGAGEDGLGGLELGATRLAKGDVVGELAQQEAQPSESTPDVGGSAEVAAVEQTTDGDLLGRMLVVAVVPVLRVVVATVVLVGDLLGGLVVTHPATLTRGQSNERGRNSGSVRLVPALRAIFALAERSIWSW